MTIKETLNELFEPNDFNISTWMAMGSMVLLCSQLFLPCRLTTLIPIFFLGYRILNMVVDTLRLHTGSYTNMMRGRWTATLPEPKVPSRLNSGSDGIVMFILGARINQSVPRLTFEFTIGDQCHILTLNSPLGKLSPGAAEINEVFQNMWHEAEQNRKKWGCKSSFHCYLMLWLAELIPFGFSSDLGRTATLVDYSDTERTPTIWLSYWKDLNGLQEFSRSAAHMLGQNNYHANKYPYMGIMHETYYAPKGCWETIYDDFPPWGLGKLGQPGSSGDG